MSEVKIESTVSIMLTDGHTVIMTIEQARELRDGIGKLLGDTTIDYPLPPWSPYSPPYQPYFTKPYEIGDPRFPQVTWC